LDEAKKTQMNGCHSNERTATIPAVSVPCCGWLALAMVLPAIWVLGALGPVRAANLDAKPKTVVLLHSYGQNFKPWSEYAKALREEIERRSPSPLIVQDFSVVTARGAETEAETQFVRYLGALFTARGPDLVIAFGAPSGGFVQRYREQLFPTAPMLLTAIEHRRVEHLKLADNDAVIAVRQDIPKMFGNILQLLPQTKTIGIVIGNSPNERFWTSEMKTELQPLSEWVGLRFYNDLSFEQMLTQAASLPRDSAIFWIQPQVDATGAVHEGDRALSELHAVASVPIFSYDDSFLTGEIVGGPMTSVAASTSAAADAALRMLGGEKANTNIMILDYGPPRYDWRQLQRWGISESRLPPGSEVLFRQPNFWERYRWQVSLLMLALVLQAGLISGLLLERQRRMRAELVARQRMAELAHVNRVSLAGELTASIAHEINQPLGAILTNAETLELIANSSSPDLEEIREIASDIRRDDERASAVITRLRSLLNNKPFEIATIDLNEVVRDSVELAAGVVRQRNFELRTQLSATPVPIAGDRVQLQQIVLNLLVNAMDATPDAPPDARTVVIGTRRSEQIAELSVADNGLGIQPERLKQIFQPFYTTKEGGMGMGLSIARTIAEAHCGGIRAENRPEGGAEFIVSLPLSTPT
jgi:signal transduction histidine kinase